jgi:hypothetical protein
MGAEMSLCSCDEERELRRRPQQTEATRLTPRQYRGPRCGFCRRCAPCLCEATLRQSCGGAADPTRVLTFNPRSPCVQQPVADGTRYPAGW